MHHIEMKCRCGSALDGRDALIDGEPGEPVVGDVMICAACGVPYILGSFGTLTLMTKEQLADEKYDLIREIVEVACVSGSVGNIQL